MASRIGSGLPGHTLPGPRRGCRRVANVVAPLQQGAGRGTWRRGQRSDRFAPATTTHPETVTVTLPVHPLRGQTLRVVRARREGSRSSLFFEVELAQGSTLRLPVGWTDLGPVSDGTRTRYVAALRAFEEFLGTRLDGAPEPIEDVGKALVGGLIDRHAGPSLSEVSSHSDSGAGSSGGVGCGYATNLAARRAARYGLAQPRVAAI